MRTLRKSKTAEILLRLLDGPKYIRELLSEVGGSAQTVEMRVQELLKEGLVAEEEWEAWPFRKMLKLTDRGKEIARLLKVEESFFTTVKKVAAKDILERGKWLLALLHAMGGKISGATRLQKLLFLLKREMGVETPYKFTPYMFGPHSPDLLDDTIDLELTGYINIQKEVSEPTLAGDCVISRKYELTPEGAKVAKEAYEKLPDDCKKALSALREFNEMKLTELLNYVYTKYPAESRGV
jgi:uncharacterized protein YwgA/DNA-binding HxlR family transcriptional regulator